ncbi:unnamed protein product [Cyclocybe aegerita]|uniref:Uncharacterized protein n=1 Tax=Cyclocybe aegerita TaxID=1973307 RepID=A0A8S0W9W7_CYCAE|nr:unnamed protein product [Cyclocybe aegerita]
MGKNVSLPPPYSRPAASHQEPSTKCQDTQAAAETYGFGGDTVDQAGKHPCIDCLRSGLQPSSPGWGQGQRVVGPRPSGRPWSDPGQPDFEVVAHSITRSSCQQHSTIVDVVLNHYLAHLVTLPPLPLPPRSQEKALSCHEHYVDTSPCSTVNQSPGTGMGWPSCLAPTIPRPPPIATTRNFDP